MPLLFQTREDEGQRYCRNCSAWDEWNMTLKFSVTAFQRKMLSFLLGSRATTCWARPTRRWNGASSYACRRYREDIQKEAHTFLGVTFTVSQQMELQPTAQHWDSINPIFKLSALKDKLQVTWLPCWTHAHRPRCQASTAPLHRLQLRSKPWLLGEPCFAGRSLPPSRSLLQKTVLGPFQLTAAAKTVPRKRGSSFLCAS